MVQKGQSGSPLEGLADEESWQDACKRRDYENEPEDRGRCQNFHKQVEDGLGQLQGKFPIAQQVHYPYHCKEQPHIGPTPGAFQVTRHNVTSPTVRSPHEI